MRIRPMAAEDVELAWDASQRAFERNPDRWPVSSESPPARRRRAAARVRRLTETDPAGAWVAEDAGGRIVGLAQAIVREGVWGLSVLAVEPLAQSTGAGTALLERALAYAEGTEGQLVLSSLDPRAIRAYARAGFALQPTMSAFGVVRRDAIPRRLGVRDGTEADLPLAAEVDRRVRGGAHGDDLAAMLRTGERMLVLPGRGYAFHRDGSPGLLAAADADAARALLWAAVAAGGPGREVGVMHISAGQDWAIEVALEAGLSLEPCGPRFVRGRLGPLAPYLPNPAYL